MTPRRGARLAAAPPAGALQARGLIALVLIASALAACALLGGCRRKPQFMPMGADSTAISSDSLTALYQEVQRAWESGLPDEELAAKTADALHQTLVGRTPGEWSRRAQRLVDSLGVGAEIASGDCAMIVNFFARSDPDAGSWPFLYWCTSGGVRHQSVEGKGLRLAQIAVRGLGADADRGTLPGVASLFQLRASAGFQPLLFVWATDTTRAKWRMTQTLGPDSLGGVGTGEFAAPDTSVELSLRTYQANAFFEECPTCPHVYRVHRFRWGPSGFRRASIEVVPSPYSTFVQFVQALVVGDESRAEELVTDPALVEQARGLGWTSRQGKWRIAPGTEETPERMVFYRGSNDAYAVHFAPRGDDWLVAGFEPAERAVE